MKQRLLFLFVALLGMTAGAKADVVLNSTNFPDENFRKVLVNEFGYSIGQTLTNSELESFTVLMLGLNGIEDLTGIEYFTKVEKLECNDNKLTSLDLSKNTALKELNCSSNQLSSLDLSKNTALTSLICYGNLLSTLDLSKNSALKVVYCSSNTISGEGMDALVNSLPTVSGGKLQVYDNEPATGNIMTVKQVAAATTKGWKPLKWDEDAYDWVDYRGILPITKEFFPDDNFRNYLLKQDYGKDQLISEDELVKITTLALVELGIKDLSGIEYFTELEGLWCFQNELKSLDVSKNTKLTVLWCHMNELETLDVSKNTELKELLCHYNNLKALDVSNNKKLSKLICNNNAIYGEAMDALVNSLPVVSDGIFDVFHSMAPDHNIITKEQVTVAKKKGWTVRYFDGNDWTEYEGYTEESLDIEGYTLLAKKNWMDVADEELLWYQFADPANGTIKGSKDGISITVTEDVGNLWDPRVSVLEGFDLEKGADYKIRIYASLPCDGQLQVNLGNWNTNFNKDFAVKTNGGYQVLEYDFDDFVGDATSAHLLFECGNFVGTSVVWKVLIYKKGGDNPDDPSQIDDDYTLLTEKDWTGVTDGQLPWYQFANPANGSAKGSADGIEITVTENVGQVFYPQALLIDDFDLKKNADYKVVVTAKLPCNGELVVDLGSWSTTFKATQTVTATGDFQQIVFDFPEYASDATNAHVIFECGNFVGTSVVKKIQVYAKGLPEEEDEAIEIGSAEQVPYCSDKNLDFSNMADLKAYVATGYDKATGTIWLTRVKQVPANTGFLLMGDAGDYDIPVVESVADCYYKNMFKGTVDATTIQTTDGEYTNYYLSKGEYGVGFYKVDGSVNLKANRCYLPIPTDITAAGSEGDAEVIKVGAALQVPYYTSKNLDFSTMEAQGVKAYTATGYNYGSGTIWLTRVKKVPAKTGVLVMAEKDGNYSVPTASVSSVYENMFVGSETAKTIYTNETIDGVDYVNYYLSNGASGLGFYKVTKEEGVSMGANRCYLPIPKRDSVSGARGESVNAAPAWNNMVLSDEGDDVIAIPVYGSTNGDADGTTNVQSSLFNVQSPEVYYNLQGQRVENPGKGLYIKNGKKVIVR